ncbi:MAG: dTDP-4-dehydrorhamnose 3,5-epimerase [Flavobacteriales bacterium]|nr:dTDP-4-dehydrorhamnose 3,5-epimerase [Flavobacteriales bacterium]
MEILDEPLKGLFVIKPRVFSDHRGYFYESYNLETFRNIGIADHFIQDNQSLSTDKNVLRGLHFQNEPFAQAKLVRVVTGAVYDVAVDIRKSSPTYGHWFGIELNEENKTLLYIPKGFAHGFVTLQPNTLFNYKCSNVYNKALEEGILWNDKDLNIDWGVDQPILSEKDEVHQTFAAFKSQF